MQHAIETSGLTKRYRGGTLALADVTLTVPRGVCYGLLGPNGAGKSTLVKTLLSIVRPTAGDATLLGRPFRSPAARQGVGYLAEGHSFPPHLSGRGVCRYMGRLAGLAGPDLEREIDEKLQLVGMADRADERITRYSKGMKQRVGLAQALLGSPELIFLDEPTDGVDPVGRKDVRDLVRAAVERNVTVFVNSHQLAELELMCDEVAILHHGALIHDGSVEEIRQLITSRRGHDVVAFRTSPAPAELLERLEAQLPENGDGSRFTLRLTPAEVTGVIDALREAKVAIHAVEPHRVSLEDAFVELVDDAKAGQP